MDDDFLARAINAAYTAGTWDEANGVAREPGGLGITAEAAVRASLARIRAVVEAGEVAGDESRMPPGFWYALHQLTADDRRLLGMEP